MSNLPAVSVLSLKSLQRQAKDHFAMGRLAEAVHYFRQGLALSESWAEGMATPWSIATIWPVPVEPPGAIPKP